MSYSLKPQLNKPQQQVFVKALPPQSVASPTAVKSPTANPIKKPESSPTTKKQTKQAIVPQNYYVDYGYMPKTPQTTSSKSMAVEGKLSVEKEKNAPKPAKKKKVKPVYQSVQTARPKRYGKYPQPETKTPTRRESIGTKLHNHPIEEVQGEEGSQSFHQIQQAITDVVIQAPKPRRSLQLQSAINLALYQPKAPEPKPQNQQPPALQPQPPAKTNFRKAVKAKMAKSDKVCNIQLAPNLNSTESSEPVGGDSVQQRYPEQHKASELININQSTIDAVENKEEEDQLNDLQEKPVPPPLLQAQAQNQARMEPISERITDEQIGTQLDQNNEEVVQPKPPVLQPIYKMLDKPQDQQQMNQAEQVPNTQQKVEEVQKQQQVEQQIPAPQVVQFVPQPPVIKQQPRRVKQKPKDYKPKSKILSKPVTIPEEDLQQYYQWLKYRKQRHSSKSRSKSKQRASSVGATAPVTFNRPLIVPPPPPPVEKPKTPRGPTPPKPKLQPKPIIKPLPVPIVQQQPPRPTQPVTRRRFVELQDISQIKPVLQLSQQEIISHTGLTSEGNSMLVYQQPDRLQAKFKKNKQFPQPYSQQPSPKSSSPIVHFDTSRNKFFPHKPSPERIAQIPIQPPITHKPQSQIEESPRANMKNSIIKSIRDIDIGDFRSRLQGSLDNIRRTTRQRYDIQLFREERSVEQDLNSSLEKLSDYMNSILPKKRGSLPHLKVPNKDIAVQRAKLHSDQVNRNVVRAQISQALRIHKSTRAIKRPILLQNVIVDRKTYSSIRRANKLQRSRQKLSKVRDNLLIMGFQSKDSTLKQKIERNLQQVQTNIGSYTQKLEQYNTARQQIREQISYDLGVPSSNMHTLLTNINLSSHLFQPSQSKPSQQRQITFNKRIIATLLRLVANQT